MDGMWKCIRTINRLSPSTPNVSSLPTQVVAYATPHTTVRCELQVCSWLLCQTGRCTLQVEPACNAGPIRGLDLSVHEVHMHVNASPTRIVEHSHGNIKDSTMHMRSYHSAGQSTERIAVALVGVTNTDTGVGILSTLVYASFIGPDSSTSHISGRSTRSSTI